MSAASSSFLLQRTSGASLRLTRAHDRSVRAAKVDWSAFDRGAHSPNVIDGARFAWSERVATETHSLGVFTRLSAELQALGAPLDWSGALARIVTDEVRHVDLALRMVAALSGSEMPQVSISPKDLELPRLTLAADSPRARARHTIVATLCLGETLSRRCLHRCFAVANVAIARDVLGVMLADETLHAQLGWELAALLSRPASSTSAAAATFDEDERRELAASLPDLFAFYRQACGAAEGAARAFADAETETDGETANFGVLTRAGYARCFYQAMREEIVPGLVAIGLPEAHAAWSALDI